jgi:two-component system chemotaxis response regulator CheB
MRTRRLLIVDDSVVIRRALTASLSREAEVEVAESASNGRVALMKIPLLRPDVVALDVEMPEMDGLETLSAIRKMHPRVQVIMLNVPTPEGTAATVDALTRGASDYVMKPEGSVPAPEALQLLSDQLLSKIALCSSGPTGGREPRVIAPNASTTPRRPVQRIDVLAIGVSTGGPQALMDLVPAFPADFPVPILIVQHMPPMFTGLLAERLTQHARIRVEEARSDQVLTPGRAWIAPGDFHLAVRREGQVVRIITHRDPPENSCRPSADVLFRSVAEVFGAHVLAVVMTGMGQDGFRGCEHVHSAGGQVIVQDEGSSVVWGMAGSVARAGMADRILPLSHLAFEIIERVERDRQRTRKAI